MKISKSRSDYPRSKTAQTYCGCCCCCCYFWAGGLIGAGVGALLQLTRWRSLSRTQEAVKIIRQVRIAYWSTVLISALIMILPAFSSASRKVTPVLFLVLTIPLPNFIFGTIATVIKLRSLKAPADLARTLIHRSLFILAGSSVGYGLGWIVVVALFN